MICQSCVDGRESECWGLTKHKSWCDNHHRYDEVFLDPLFCKHPRLTNQTLKCPSCGKDNETIMHEEVAEAAQLGDNFDSTDRDGGGTAEQPMDFGYLSLPAETQRDIEDNFVTEKRDDTIYADFRSGVDQTYTKPVKRSIIPRRNKETPSS